MNDNEWLQSETMTLTIGGSRGGREGRTPPPGRPNFFDFMQFSGKFGVFTPPLEGSRPPLGKILDPPLLTPQTNYHISISNVAL